MTRTAPGAAQLIQAMKVGKALGRDATPAVWPTSSVPSSGASGAVAEVKQPAGRDGDVRHERAYVLQHDGCAGAFQNACVPKACRTREVARQLRRLLAPHRRAVPVLGTSRARAGIAAHPRCADVRQAELGRLQRIPARRSVRYATRWSTTTRQPAIGWKRRPVTGQGNSIHINARWRVCFVWRDGAAHDVEIVDYH